MTTNTNTFNLDLCVTACNNVMSLIDGYYKHMNIDKSTVYTSIYYSNRSRLSLNCMDGM